MRQKPVFQKSLRWSRPRSAAGSPPHYGDFSGVTGQFTEEGAVLQEWYLSHSVALLYCTYACDAEDAGMDMPAVEEILGTLVPGDALLVG